MSDPKTASEAQALAILTLARHHLEKAANLFLAATDELGRPRPGRAIKMLQRGYSQCEDLVNNHVSDEGRALFAIQLAEAGEEAARERAQEEGAGDTDAGEDAGRDGEAPLPDGGEHAGVGDPGADAGAGDEARALAPGDEEHATEREE